MTRSITTQNSDGTISEIEVSTKIAEFDKEYRGKEKYYKKKTKNFPSFDELMELNECCDENCTAKLPMDPATPSFETEAISNIKS